MPKESTRKKEKKVNLWIQSAKLKKGTLTNYMINKHGREKALTERGTLDVNLLKSELNNPNVSKKTKRRIRLALNLRKF